MSRPIAAVALDADGRIISWNSTAEHLKGYKAEEIIGKHFSVFYPPERVTAEYPESKLKRAADTGFDIDDGWRVHKDGHRWWAHVFTTAQYDATHTLLGFISVIRDDRAWSTGR